MNGVGWVSAEALEPGDCVQTSKGTCRTVAGVRVVTADTWVYNFTVDQAHTYFVGDGQWLVHNQCIGGFLDDLLSGGGDLHLGTVDTRFGRFEVGGRAIINGTQLHISDGIIFPEGADYSNVGIAKVMSLMMELGRAAKKKGFETLHISGFRVSGANPGHEFEITLDLFKNIFD